RILPVAVTGQVTRAAAGFSQGVVTINRTIRLNMAPILRQARSLVGWMTLDQVRTVGTSQQAGRQLDPAFETHAARARTAVAARPVGVDQTNITREPPEELTPYTQRLRTNPASGQYFNDGWEVRLVDLRRICAIQPSVFT